MKILKRPICWARGHSWRLLRANRLANLHLAHLFEYAGCDADCERCGYEWRDFEFFNRYPWLES